MKLLEQKLSGIRFIRVHRSFIVKLERIDTIERRATFFSVKPIFRRAAKCVLPKGFHLFKKRWNPIPRLAVPAAIPWSFWLPVSGWFQRV